MKHVIITTDGSCSPNPGKGGWGAVLRFGTAMREISGFDPDTTNNEMEIHAVIEGVMSLKEPCEVTIRTDSKIAISWCGGHLFAKEKHRRKYPKAWLLVQAYKHAARRHHVKFEWVKGHDGDADNERAHELAQDRSKSPF